MIVYKLERNVDGYGGCMKDLYFSSFSRAREELIKTPGLHCIKGEWYIEFMKGCDVFEDNNNMSVKGITYPINETIENIRYYICNIIQINLPFNIINNKFYTINHNSGYTNWLYRQLESDDYHYCNNDNKYIIAYCKSKRYAKKIANQKKGMKNIAKSWIRSEEEERISPIGRGESYLSISEINLIS